MKRTGYLFLIAFFFLSPIGRADVITSYTFQQWGQESLTQIESDFGRSDGLYNNSITQMFPAYAWPQGIMFSANVAAARVDHSRLSRTEQQAQAIYDQYRCYFNGIWSYNAGANACGDRYYDDNAWLALAYMELYNVTENAVYLSWAQEIVAFCMSGENGPGDTPDGGIRWHETNTCGDSVCATAPTCLANLMIYRATGTEQYLTDGIRLYEWLRTSGVQASSGLYHQGIKCDGSVNYGYRGYQTAVPLQAALRLYQITGDDSYLTEAQRLAMAMEDFWINWETCALGEIGYWGGHDMTNAYVELYEIDHNPHWLNIVVGYLEYLHDNCKVGDRYPDSWNETGGTASSELLANVAVARAYWKMASTPGGTALTYLRIKNRHSQKCLQLYNSQTADNTNVVIYDEKLTWLSQLWTLVDLGNGYFNIRSQYADKSLQPYNSQNEDDTNVVIYAVNVISHSQQWLITDLGNGYFNIQNRLTAKSLKPLNSLTTNNTNVVTYTTDVDQQSQQWTFVSYNPPTSITSYLSIDGVNWLQTNRTFLNTGETISLRAETPGTGTWTWEGPEGFTANENEITLQNMQPNQSGCYIAIYTNNSGIKSCSAFHITVYSCVKLYQHCDYFGWQASFGVGAYTAADLVATGGLNNDASSVKITPGYTVTFYDNDNFQGSTLTKTSDDTCFVNEGWNDRITSMIIEGEVSPVAYWQFNDNEGTTAGDASGNGYDGQLITMDQTNWVDGKQCSALSFNGIDNYVQITGFNGISGTAGRTCSAWIKTTIMDQSATILTWGVMENGQKWIFRISSQGNLEVGVRGGYIQGGKVINDGRWHHVAAVLENDGTPDVSEIYLYVDGVLETNTYVSSFQTVNTSEAQNVLIGIRKDNDLYYIPFSGLIDEVRIYDRPLSAAEVQDIFRQHVLIGDTESDGDVDLNDFAVLANFWQNSAACDVDLTCDCKVDIDDFLILINEWLQQVP